MKTQLIKTGLILSFLPSLSFAIQPGFYGDGGIGVSAGPSSVVALSSGFVGSGMTLNGGVTDWYGLNSRGAVGAFADLGYNVFPYLGVEANYTYWGSQSLSSFTGQITSETGGLNGHLQSQSVGGSVVGYAPFDNNLVNIFAKIGVSALFSTFAVADPSNSIFFNAGSYSQSSTNAALTYGAGAIYQYTPNVSLQLAWNGISSFDNGPISNLYYNMGSIGVRYTFPNQVAASTYEK